MPGTQWSAPMQPLAQSSVTITSATLGTTLTDISPSTCLIPPGTLNVGTRIRLLATGSYIATTTATSIAFGFYMNNAGAGIATTPAVLALSAGTAIGAISGGLWVAKYFGRVAAISTTTGTNASVVGHGEVDVAISLTLGTIGSFQMPITLALCTVAQTATGLITYNEQNIMIGATLAVNTGFTSLTTDELTCELLG